MNFTIDKKELSALTTMVHRAASNKNTIPVLSGMLLEVSNDRGLTMTATDMEIGIQATTKNVDIIDEGSVLVNAYYFTDFIKLLPDSPISIKLDQESSKLNITYGRSSGSINTYLQQEYPNLPIDSMSYNFSIGQDILREALRKTSLAVATSHFRQVFTGVLFDLNDTNTLKVVASDTHRLAFFSHPMKQPPKEPLRFIIPLRTVNELTRLLEDSPDKIDIAFTENNVIFYNNQFLLLSRLIEGQYPNYEQVIPSSFNTHATIDTRILIQSMERARTMPMDSKVKFQHFKLSFCDNEAIINAYSEIMGEIEEHIEDITIDGDTSINIAFNTNYFLEAVKLLAPECSQISVSFSGSLGPAMIKNPEKDDYIYILVPLRTTN
ncbi:MAG: DNA polymerase III subunit beta [Syntrophomonadaceae bacterium]|jgi:DNA polymerase-3 subunit beta